jgi:hypothetical protein
MLYEKARELTQLSLRHWLDEEVFSFGWFLLVAVLIVAYIVWLKLLDKRRATELLLIGSLEAVAKSINSIVLGGLLGLANYNIKLLPIHPNVFISSITLSPIIVMLAEQYSHSWKSYIIRTAIGNALLCFVIFPVYMLVGALEFHNWNVFFHFLVLFTISLIVRLAFLWITGTQKRHTDMPIARKP